MNNFTEDRSLTWGERGDIPLVIDQKGKTLVTVKDVQSWVEKCKNSVMANANRGRPREVDNVSQRQTTMRRQRLEELEVSSDSEPPSSRTRKQKRDRDEESSRTDSPSPPQHKHKEDEEDGDDVAPQKFKKRKVQSDKKHEPASSAKPSRVPATEKIGLPGKGKIKKTVSFGQKNAGAEIMKNGGGSRAGPRPKLIPKAGKRKNLEENNDSNQGEPSKRKKLS